MTAAGHLARRRPELSLAPQPGLASLDQLRAEMGQAGLPVQARVEGQPAPLPPGVDLAAYRIVQEALTNTLRHGGPAHADVLVRYHKHALELEILDDGCGPGPGPTSRAGGQSGHGLVGMRERVTLYDGTLHAGPRAAPAGTGYAVRVRLPTKPEGT
jgi:signal transduction histidine kinase